MNERIHSLSGAVSSDVKSEENRANHQKPDGAGDIQACPEVKRQLWGGEFWSDGYFVSTVGAHATEDMIKNYVQQQGKLEENGQLRLF